MTNQGLETPSVELENAPLQTVIRTKTRIPEFLEKLSQIPSGDKHDAKVWSVSLLELKYLKSTFTLNAFRSACSDYRKAITDDDRFGDAHIANKHMRPSKLDQERQKQAFESNVLRNAKNIRSIDPDQMLAVGESVLRNPKEYTTFEVVGALLLGTGCRPSDLWSTASFSEYPGFDPNFGVEEPHCIFPEDIELYRQMHKAFDGSVLMVGFDGKNDAASLVLMPTLYEPLLVLSGIDHVRQSYGAKIEGLSTQQLNDRTSKSLNTAVKELFALPSGETLAPKDLRVAYTAIAYHDAALQAPPEKALALTFNEFAAAIFHHNGNSPGTAIVLQKFAVSGMEDEFLNAHVIANETSIQYLQTSDPRLTDPAKRDYVTKDIELFQKAIDNTKAIEGVAVKEFAAGTLEQQAGARDLSSLPVYIPRANETLIFREEAAGDQEMTVLGHFEDGSRILGRSRGATVLSVPIEAFEQIPQVTERVRLTRIDSVETAITLTPSLDLGR